MVLMILVSLGFGLYRNHGVRALAAFGLLLMAVGPWFAYLASECLPVRSSAVRRTIAHFLLLVLFGLGLWSSHVWRAALDNRLAIWLMPAALTLWIPQYLAFFLFQRDEV